MQTKFDVIVIGSGIAGLTTASLLSQICKKRVLVLESHFKLGGFTHAFQRKGYTWDVGLHYVGDMNPGSLPRQVMDFVTGGTLQWQKMNGPHEHFIYPDHYIQVPAGVDNYKDVLKSEFPHCAIEIDRYFDLVIRAKNWVKRWTICKQFPRLVGKLVLGWGRRLATRTVKDVLESTISDPKLRGLLVSQRGNYGLPPGECAFGMHALVVSHYLDGGWVPVGGSEQIAASIVPIIRAHGGDCRVNHKVREIVIENNVATRVVVEHKNKTIEFEAPLIISAAGADKTFNSLIRPNIQIPERQLLEGETTPPPTTVNVYIGLKQDPSSIGMGAGNYWIVNGYDHDALRMDEHPEHGVQYGYGFLSCASLRDTTAKKHVAQIIFMSDFKPWEQWSNQEWLRRDDVYAAKKKAIAESAIKIINDQLPGFRDLVEYAEVSTPLSVESLVGHKGGAIYGIAATPQRFNSEGFYARSSVKQLLMTGSDVGTFGIVGAMMSAVMTTSAALGAFGLFVVMANIKRRARRQPPVSPREVTSRKSGGVLKPAVQTPVAHEMWFDPDDFHI